MSEITGGEKPKVRETMDKMIQRSIENGARPEWAEKKAIEAARRWDRRQDGLPTSKEQR